MIADLPLHNRPWSLLATASIALSACATQIEVGTPQELAQRVEIRRTTYGVPHILAQDEAALGFGLAYCQLEDYGTRVIRGLIDTRGEAVLYLGGEANDVDFHLVMRHRRAAETWPLLDPDVRAMMEGFALGVNSYIDQHRDELPEWARREFTGIDVHSRVVGMPAWGAAPAFLRRMGVETAGLEVPDAGDDPDVGSNAWAFAPSRTTSGHAILMRNPHLSWSAGYYEAQLTIPGRLNFYGDVRIGGPLEMIAGFNDNLGWATTNNSPSLNQIYELEAAPDQPDHYWFNGAPVPLRREEVTVPTPDGSETREFWFTELGPVIHRTAEKVYTLKTANDGEFRYGQQFLRMMQAENLEEWRQAVATRAKPSSNLTYADRDGNIYYVWNASLPLLPHPASATAVPASGTAEVWRQLLPFDQLPQLQNPAGGYVHNENDPPYFTNLNEVLRPSSYPPNLPANRLRLRSQHSLELIHNDRKFSLEEVWELKHSMRALLADRVKDELVAAVRAGDPGDEVAAAIELLAGWDNSVAPASQGGVLFQIWWQRYTSAVGGVLQGFATQWSATRPTTTPRGLSDTAVAADAFAWAVEETARRHGSWDVAWGDVHRIRVGEVDLPIGGGGAGLGCFRVLSFRREDDGKLAASSGDGWVFAVEFGEVPRAYSVLAYGQSSAEDSPYRDDQAELFATGQGKTVAFTEADIRAQLLQSYRPGEDRR